jgi:prevent-host-death family protein
MVAPALMHPAFSSEITSDRLDEIPNMSEGQCTMATINRNNPFQPKTRTVSSNEAKQHWGAMMKAASEGEDVIVESHGKPKAVVISAEAYEQLQGAREHSRRQAMLDWLQAFEARQRERNKDLTPEQVEEIAIRAGREINAAVAERARDSAARRGR